MKKLVDYIIEFPVQDIGPYVLSFQKLEKEFSSPLEAIDFLVQENLNNFFMLEELRSLKCKYENLKLHNIHVSYWVAPDENIIACKSTGETVKAFDIFHAGLIVMRKRKIRIDQILYIHNKDSEYKP